jgi:hypothetical protein
MVSVRSILKSSTRLIPIISFLLITASVYGRSRTEQALDAKSGAIQKVLRKGVEKNKAFLDAHHVGNLEKEKKARKEAEAYFEEEVEPALTSATQILSVKKDTRLAAELLRFSRATSSSASEATATALGSIFLKNPDALISELKAFGIAEQREILRDLEFGVKNAAFMEKPEPSLLEAREALLTKLKSNTR